MSLGGEGALWEKAKVLLWSGFTFQESSGISSEKSLNILFLEDWNLELAAALKMLIILSLLF